MENKNNYLVHYGILGMHWGIRRSKTGSGSSSRKQKKNKYISKDAKQVNNLKKKKLNQLSNEELKTINKRQDLENKYRQNNKSSIAKGFAVAGTVAATLGTIVTLYNNSSNMINIGKKVVEKPGFNKAATAAVRALPNKAKSKLTAIALARTINKTAKTF